MRWLTALRRYLDPPPRPPTVREAALVLVDHLFDGAVFPKNGNVLVIEAFLWRAAGERALARQIEGYIATDAVAVAEAAPL